MQDYIILTGGPVMHKQFGAFATCRKYVERYAPLKRGWTGVWDRPTQGLHRYIRYNRNGVKQYTVTVLAGDRADRFLSDHPLPKPDGIVGNQPLVTERTQPHHVL